LHRKLNIKIDNNEYLNTSVSDKWQDYKTQPIYLATGQHTLTVSNTGFVYRCKMQLQDGSLFC